MFFADGTASAYAIDAATGKEIWTRKLDSHPYAKATGSVTVHDGRVYVPLAGVGEEGQGGGGDVRVLHVPRQRHGARTPTPAP